MATCASWCAKCSAVTQYDLSVKLNDVPLLLQRMPKQAAGVPLPSSLYSAPATADGIGWTGQVTNVNRGRDRGPKVNKGCVSTTSLQVVN